MVTMGSKVLYQHIAQLLEYPSMELVQEVNDCTKIMAEISPHMNEVLAEYYRYVKQEPLSRVEETYTRTFDLQGICPPYIGYHIFGESYKRSWFMARLNESYREKGFMAGNELPDHISVILRYLALGTEEDFARVLECEGLKPAVAIMLAIFGENGENPYRYVLEALSMLLDQADRAFESTLVEPEREV